MKILALEFSSPVRSVAVRNGAKNGFAEERTGRETKPFALIDAVLQQAGLTRDEIECIAVGLGPGSYAGIRTAIALAQGWELARGVKLIGLSSADVLAAQVAEAGEVWIGLESPPGHLYAARYETSGSAGARLIEPFRLLRAEEIPVLKIQRLDKPEALEEMTSAPNATTLARLAEAHPQFTCGPALEPIYLRPVDYVKAPPPRFSAD